MDFLSFRRTNKKTTIMKTTIFLLLISVIVFFSSCAKLPVYESKEYVANEKEDIINPAASNYDKKTNISFEVANNDSYFFIQAVFHDRQSYMKIMRGGLIVYFDPSGKKKKQYQLKIERAQKQKIDMASMMSQMGMNPSARAQDLPSVIDATYTKVTWDKNGDEFVFYRNMIKDPISVDLGPNQSNELILKIKIPLNEIPLTEGQNIFSMGIESGTISTSGMQGNRQNSGMRGGGSGGHSGGGGGGGRGGRGMGGGKSGGGSRPDGNTLSGMEPLKLWFQVELKK